MVMTLYRLSHKKNTMSGNSEFFNITDVIHLGEEVCGNVLRWIRNTIAVTNKRRSYTA